MMPSTIKYGLIFSFLLLFNQLGAQTSQNLSSWYWLQLRYKINKKTYINTQYQARLNHAPLEFGQSSFYFSVERKFTKKWQGELLYQLTTNFSKDQHTFYAGITRTKNFKLFKLFYRGAWQMNRLYFTGNPTYDKPYSEIRNRIRVQLPHNKFRFAISSELFYRYNQSFCFNGSLTRIRNIALMSYNLNRYQSFSLFYLYEPSLNRLINNHNDHVIGLVYQINLPKKIHKLKHFFEADHDKSKNNNQDSNDSFN